MHKSANISFGLSNKKSKTSPLSILDSSASLGLSALEAHKQSMLYMNNEGKSPLIGSAKQAQDSLVCFEDKYVVLDVILGEGCASVVKPLKRIEKELFLEGSDEEE